MDAIRAFGYDITHSVTARTILTIEFRPWKTCFEKVYAPLDAMLKYLARRRPQKLRMMSDISFHGKESDRSEIDLILPGDLIVYVGSVINKDCAEREFQHADPESQQQMHQKGLLAIRQDTTGRRIPLNVRVINFAACEAGAKKFLAEISDAFDSVTIEFLDDTLANQLYCRILQEAYQRSDPRRKRAEGAQRALEEERKENPF